MKKLYFLFFLTIGFFANAQIVNIPDANFKTTLLNANPSTGIASTQTPDADGWVSTYHTIDTNGDGEIQVSEAQAIKYLRLTDNIYFSNLTGLEAFINLEYFQCYGSSLTSLDLSNSLSLRFLWCQNNNISNLNISQNTLLKVLHCEQNNLSNLDVSNSPNLKSLWCSYNLLTNLNLTQNIFLEELYCDYNSFSSLDIGQNVSLKQLILEGNQISSIDLSSNIMLVDVGLSFNNLTSLNTSQLSNLQTLGIRNNQLTSLDLSQNLQLASLGCQFNQITNLNTQGNPLLNYLYCQGNLISEFNFTNNPLLQYLVCGANNITTLDVSNLNNLFQLNCNNSSNLTYINMKNGSIEDNSYMNFNLCPNLEFICCDDAQLTQVQNLITTYNYTNCSASALDCTYPFPNELSGNVKYDFWEDGCDVLDIVVPNVKYNVFDGTDTFVTFGNQDGNYFMSLVDGNYSITPVVEQPNYFNVSPNNVTINFPALTSPHVQDFCVTWNQIDYFDDLEVTILPMSPARPGYEAVYKVMVRNKGFDTTYGTVSLTYDNSILTYVSSNPLFANTTTNSLSWDILQIIPFEVLEYEVRFNLNSPTASPPVNNGDELHFTAQVAHEVYIEYTPDDNTFTLDQTVVGSYDPNDKVCLQGETEDVSIVGEYVHYMIRFENTGTFLAEKVVVEDFIDVSKFDITTLIPLNASHAYYAKITGNKVEFIFDNINLDFNDPNNDGFIAFKIKLLPTLVVGDTFTNSANIYFDFNPAIVTDSYTTTIVETLSNETFENNSFALYPNPAKDILNIEFKNQTEIKSVAIYNLIGQLVISVPNVTNSIDVSSLASGTYFVKINSEKGSANAKFVKE